MLLWLQLQNMLQRRTIQPLGASEVTMLCVSLSKVYVKIYFTPCACKEEIGASYKRSCKYEYKRIMIHKVFL